MREIKFRIWDGDSLYMAEQLWLEPLKAFRFIDGLYDEDDIIMQYTGLKDKNGVEIYEGDIVEVADKYNLSHLRSCDNYESDQAKYKDIFIVKSLLSGFTLSKTDSDIPNICGNINNYAFWNGAEVLEVVGNIYENKELLTQSNE